MNISINGATLSLEFGDTAVVLTGTLDYPPAFEDRMVPITNEKGEPIGGFEVRKVAVPRERPANTTVVDVDAFEALARGFITMIEERRKARDRRAAEGGLSNYTTPGGK